MSWAAIATKPAQKPQVTPLRADSTVDVAVLDANAIISGEGLLLLSKLANRAITTPEVLAEVRDKKSRATLEALPYKIEQLEPAPEDIKAVMRFAQATGDAHSLSRADIRLIALTRTLEVARHGSAHLKTQPPPLVSSSRRPRAPPVHGKLPGWGDTSETWSELERINAEEEAAEKALLAAAKAAGRAAGAAAARQEADVSGSRIASQMQTLVLDDAAVEAVGAEGLRGAQTGVAPGPSGSEEPTSVPAPRQPVAAAPPAEEAQPEEKPSSAPDGNADDDGWTQSSNSKKLKQKKAKEAEAAAALAAAERKREARRRRAASRRARRAEEAAASGAQAAAEVEAAAGTDSEEDATSAPSPVAEPASADVEDVEDVEGAEQAPGDEAALDQQQESKEEEEVEDVERHLDEEAPGAEGPSAQTSSVCILTGDFAMQNVIVQMGLRLVTKDNQRITRLSQWVLRCTACYAVSKVGRMEGGVAGWWGGSWVLGLVQVSVLHGAPLVGV